MSSNLMTMTTDCPRSADRLTVPVIICFTAVDKNISLHSLLPISIRALSKAIYTRSYE